MGTDAELTEGRAGVSRVEAFSDGVMAIIITIMVLELKAPEDPDPAALWRLWPTFIAYLLSYVYVAIYWVNHHRLFGHARRVTSRMLWANIALLFTLSLVPFSTAYLGEHHFHRDGTILYLISLLLPALAYAGLQAAIMETASCSPADRRYLEATRRKGLAAAFVYMAGIAISFVIPALGMASAALVALFWCVPFGPLDRLFLPADCEA
jgi:uncharacterized membrane protein